MTFVLEHVRRFKNNNEKISFKNHASIITSYLRRIYETQDPKQRNQIGELLTCYVLGMSLPKTIDRLYTKKAGLSQYIELFKTQFRKELLGDMSGVFQIEDKYVTNLLDWAKKLFNTTYWTPPEYNAARDQLEQLKMVNLSSIKLTEEIAAVVHNILHIVLTRLFRLRMVKLDQSSLCAAIRA